MKEKAPVHKIRPDVEYMPPENYEPPELKIVIKEPELQKCCFHEHVQIFPHHRIITCAECGAKLDPFEHLLSVARHENNTLSHTKVLKQQVKVLFEEKEQLQRDIAKLKSEKKKL